MVLIQGLPCGYSLGVAGLQSSEGLTRVGGSLARWLTHMTIGRRRHSVFSASSLMHHVDTFALSCFLEESHQVQLTHRKGDLGFTS